MLRSSSCDVRVLKCAKIHQVKSQNLTEYDKMLLFRCPYSASSYAYKQYMNDPKPS